MRRLFVIAVIVIAIAGAAAIGYFWSHSSKAVEILPENPLRHYDSLANSKALDAERRKLAAEYEKKVDDYFVQGAAREKALREELTKANAEQKKALEAEIARLRKQLEDFAAALEK